MKKLFLLSPVIVSILCLPVNAQDFKKKEKLGSGHKFSPYDFEKDSTSAWKHPNNFYPKEKIFYMQKVAPDSSFTYNMPFIKPDSNIDYKMMMFDPTSNGTVLKHKRFNFNNDKDKFKYKDFPGFKKKRENK